MKFLVDIIVIIVFATTGFFLYQQYWDQFKNSWLTDDPVHTIYIGSVAIAVTVADTEQKRMKGLSGTQKLRDLEGKLFVFPENGHYGFWMKDMLIPLDIIWIDKNLQIVHFEENVSPDTFPKVFTPDEEAHFVLEMNAHFVSSLKLKLGDRLTLPSILLTPDIKKDLQQ